MSENHIPDENLADEFRNLGQNLIQLLQAAWDHPERRRIQDEIEKGLSEFGGTLKRESEAFIDSPSGQQIKTDFEDLGQRLRSGETQSKLREELLTGLQSANAELQKIIDHWSSELYQDESEPPS